MVEPGADPGSPLYPGRDHDVADRAPGLPARLATLWMSCSGRVCAWNKEAHDGQAYSGGCWRSMTSPVAAAGRLGAGLTAGRRGGWVSDKRRGGKRGVKPGQVAENYRHYEATSPMRPEI